MRQNVFDAVSYFQKNDPLKACEHFQNKMAYTTGPVELNEAQKKGAQIVIVDVRDVNDYRVGHIPAAISLPKDKWESLRGLEKDKLHVIYCYSSACHLGARACIYFAIRGYSVMELEGGWKQWEAHKLPVQGMNKKAA